MRKNLKLFFAGALMNLALAPFYIFPVLFLSFPYLYKSLKAAENAKQAFWSGWWFAFGYFVFGLYWIANSLLVDLRFAWLIPFAISLIPAASALFFAVACYAFKRLKLNAPTYFALLWVLAEYVKGLFPFGGFPWNDIGYASLFSIHFAQIASIGGVSFAGFVVIIISLIAVSKHKWPAALTTILCFAYGLAVIDPTKFTDKTVALIQPNIQQSLKWDAARAQNNFLDTAKLAASTKADLIIWPESAVPYPIENNPEVAQIIADSTANKVIASSTRVQGNYEKIWNSLYVMDSSAKILNYYDKHHLVPFGEYVPLRKFLPIDKITPGMIDFSAGEKGKVIQLDDHKFLPLICYEIIFAKYAKGNYDFIVNITNDAWFGNSTGPRQHLAMAQMRAIEQGKPVLRAANTGISAIIDANGRIVKKLTFGEKGIISAKIPQRLVYTTTYAGIKQL